MMLEPWSHRPIILDLFQLSIQKWPMTSQLTLQFYYLYQTSVELIDKDPHNLDIFDLILTCYSTPLLFFSILLPLFFSSLPLLHWPLPFSNLSFLLFYFSTLVILVPVVWEFLDRSYPFQTQIRNFWQCMQKDQGLRHQSSSSLQEFRICHWLWR